MVAVSDECSSFCLLVFFYGKIPLLVFDMVILSDAFQLFDEV